MMPNEIIVCDIESTHKIVSCAEIITIAFIKMDLEFNVTERRSWKMAPLYWSKEHDAASIEAHKITREEAMSYPEKKSVLREIYKWLNDGKTYIFAGYFNRAVFGMCVSFDYALLKQEFLDQSVEAYFKFGQIFPRKYICSAHTIATKANDLGLIHVPLTIKEGNKIASYDFSLGNICRIMKIEINGHHNAEVDADVTYILLKKLAGMMDIFEVIKNDWRDENEQSNFDGKIGARSGIEIHQLWNCSSQIVDSDEGISDD